MLHLNMMKNNIIQKIQAVNLSETNNIDYLEYTTPGFISQWVNLEP